MNKPLIAGMPLGDITPAIKKSLDMALARTLTLQQGKLAKANPKDTGRMASSWFISQNEPERGSRPANWGAPDEQKLEISRYPENAIEFDGTWYISNNVPYALYTALYYQPKVPKAGKDWYTAIANQTNAVFNVQYNKVKPK
jgi:hypothetical protein